ncbi:Ectonucleotide pyrophosphatase/phosphodiesterase family member 6 [Orchesella cincta]|uniref:Ectonucleotide pyrophosphatase/phosphodiesterase family member 6 n=1 Tax=Orchesella cincta TaxID=48709 RepID=A0A1D2NK49_ORCCI|nr:Ectonucleotide pyrophosphatase/phosphodiesterase family member 6 [Orchesella cincta]
MKEASQKTCDVFKLCLAVGITVTFLCDFPSTQAASDGDSGNEEKGSGTHQKLLIIMLDGFRWDYYKSQKDELIAFPVFLQDGVQAEWVEPIFPSLSYPCWTTISTGVYPEVHGIIGNYMFDLKKEAMFDIFNHSTTRMEHWWQNSEPLWTTATRHKRKTFLRYWSRCDVAFDQIKPDTCSGFTEARGAAAIKETLSVAVENLQKDYDLVMVYSEHIDNVGHKFGPESPELKQAMRDVDSALSDFLDNMLDTGLDEKVNIVILGDHGMKGVGEGSNVTYLSLDDYINASDVYKVLDRGAVFAITPYAKRLEQVYEGLKGKEGFDVYRREEIPEHFHYKNNRLVQDILVVAQPNYFIRGLAQSSKQVPRDPATVQYWGGTHGYPNMTEMRTIFFAKGPGFKKGLVHPPIQLVDVYQIFAHLLDIPARPHNGSWTRVSGMLTSRSAREAVCDLCIIIFTMCLTLFNFVHYPGTMHT